MNEAQDHPATPAEAGPAFRPPWHMRVLTGYLVLAGLWTGGGLLWMALGNRRFLVLLPGACVCLALIAALSLGAAFALLKRSKLAIAALLAIALLQWADYALFFPGHEPLADYSIDLDYFRQLPSWLKATVGLYLAMAAYCLWLWKRRLLR